jgi:hypothetical protein
MRIIVSSCADCPFCNRDSQFGRDKCNVDISIEKTSEELPDDKVELDCPLINWEIKIQVNPRLKVINT